MCSFQGTRGNKTNCIQHTDNLLFSKLTTVEMCLFMGGLLDSLVMLLFIPEGNQSA